ncbi:MAG: diversity-generating retroelement protein Avd [Beijerinckiaceae bacterium]|nr:diversity-generating retroelement protein Avd [Beijerinckiaceae bacterium]MCI0736155.1 diversity-generating retroelement protein Avd [Beijerinckiaceae bacterium]
MIDNSRRTGAAIEAHYQFLTWLAPAIEKFPRSHKFTTGDRIQNLALDVLETLIEATYTKERVQHLRKANLGIEKLRFLFRLAVEVHYLDQPRYEDRHCELKAKQSRNVLRLLDCFGAHAPRNDGPRRHTVNDGDGSHARSP